MTTYRVPSRTDPKRVYSVTVGAGVSSCECRAATFGRPCRHLAAARQSSLSATLDALEVRAQRAEELAVALRSEAYGLTAHIDPDR